MIAYFLSAIFSVAASQAIPPAAAPAPAANPGNRGALFVSPMGEPFRRQATRAAALEAWFVQADTDGNRLLSVSEMQADAARFFAVLDRTRDREIDPDDINHYESVVVPEIRMMGAAARLRSAIPGYPMGKHNRSRNWRGGLAGSQRRSQLGVTGRERKSPRNRAKGCWMAGFAQYPPTDHFGRFQFQPGRLGVGVPEGGVDPFRAARHRSEWNAVAR